MQRHQLNQRPRRNHHARGVYAGIPHQTFKLPRRVEQLPHLRIFLVGLLQRRGLGERVVQFDIQRSRHHLRDSIHIAVGHIHNAPDILDRRFRRHGAEGDDLRDIFPPILMSDVVDHLPAPVHAEIDIDIRHRNTFRVQKSFE